MCDSGAGSPVERLAGERDIWWGTSVQLWMCQMPAGVIASSVFSARSYCVLLLPQRLEWPRSPLPYWSLKCWATSLLWLDCVSASWVSHILLCVWFRFSQVRALTSSSLLSSVSSSSSSFLNCMDFSYTNRGFIGKPSGKYRDLTIYPSLFCSCPPTAFLSISHPYSGWTHMASLPTQINSLHHGWLLVLHRTFCGCDGCAADTYAHCGITWNNLRVLFVHLSLSLTPVIPGLLTFHTASHFPKCLRARFVLCEKHRSCPHTAQSLHCAFSCRLPSFLTVSYVSSMSFFIAW